MRKKIFIFILIIFSFFVYSQNEDEAIANRIHDILIEEYDKYENATIEEKIILKFGRKAYFESVKLWRENYSNIENIKITLHPQVEKMAKIVDKNLPEEQSNYFRSLLTELTFLAYKNLQLYFLAVKDYLKENKLSSNDVKKETIDIAIAMPKFFNLKIEMYDREEFLKNEIREIMNKKEVKYKLAFYAFAFDYFNKIRKKIIAKDIERMKETMEKYKNKNL